MVMGSVWATTKNITQIETTPSIANILTAASAKSVNRPKKERPNMQTNDTDFFAAALNEYRNQQDHLCIPFESLTPCEQSRIIQRAQSLKMEAKESIQ
jgi:hypothetical protein